MLFFLDDVGVGLSWLAKDARGWGDPRRVADTPKRPTQGIGHVAARSVLRKWSQSLARGEGRGCGDVERKRGV